MDEIRARALIARLPGLTAEQLRPLIAAAGGEPAAILTRRALDAPDLPPAARAFLASPDETALDADLAWVRVSGARILLCTDPEYPPLRAQERLAHHRTPGGRAGPRGVRDPRLHPQSGLPRLSPTHPRGRQARRGGRRRVDGAADFASQRDTYGAAQLAARGRRIGQGV